MSIDKAKALKTAQKYSARGQLDRAIVEYEKIVAADPADARSLLKLGDVYTRQGDPRGAITAYRKVAKLYAEQGFFLKAMAVFKQILKLDPADLAASENLGEMYEMLSLTSDALSTYEYVAEAYARAGTPEKATHALGRLTELDGGNVASWIRYAEMLSKSNRVDEAADAFRRGADLLKEQGRIDDYIKVTERLLFHSHEDRGRALELAQIYIERNQGKAALPHLQTCFKTDAKDALTLELLARAFASLGQHVKAVSVYKELVRVQAEAGNDDAERATLMELRELEPENAEVVTRLEQLGPAPAGARAPADDAVEEVELDDVELLDEPPEATHTPVDDAERSVVIRRLMSECEVFVRYGLRDKIVAQLNRVLELDRNHIDAREKLRDAHLDRGEVELAVKQLLLLSDIVAQSDPARSVRYLEQAALLQPSDETVAVRLRFSLPPPPGPTTAPPVSEELDDEPQMTVGEPEVDESDFSDLASEPPTALSPNEVLLPSASDPDPEPELLFEAGEDDEEQAREHTPLPAPGDQRAETAPPSPMPEGLADLLQEADFYISQRLFEEAREVLDDAQQQFGARPELALAAARMQQQPAPSPQKVVSTLPPPPPVTTQQLALEAASNAHGPVDVGTVLEQFKQGLRQQVDAADTSTHYDLGIAYMEMGLHGEAIEEFNLCLSTAAKECTAHTMIGLCYVAKGEMQSGIDHFEKALQSPSRLPDEELDLWFEIGNAHELLEQSAQALDFYSKVKERNPRFRDVIARIDRLTESTSDTPEVDEFDAMFDNMIRKD